MNTSSDILPQASSELIRHLWVAHQAVGSDFLPNNFQEFLDAIKYKTEIVKINNDKSHPLWWFIPAILYSLFDQAIDFDWLESDRMIKQSIVLVPPPFTGIESQLYDDISSLGMTVSTSTHLFTQRMIGLLYGGFPWFSSFWRICEARHILNRECVVLSIEAKELDVPGALELFKRRRRNLYGKSLQLACEDLAYPGVVRPFHSPSRIETTRHRYAVNVV
jgi:hypothetical protein